MYENETHGSTEELQEQIKDLQAKVTYLDNHMNHKDFSIVTKDGKEVFFENFLAKEVLATVRKVLVGKVVKQEMECDKDHCWVKPEDKQ